MTENNMLHEDDLPKIAHELAVKYAIEKFFRQNFQGSGDLAHLYLDAYLSVFEELRASAPIRNN